MPVVKYLLASFDANTLIVSTTVLQQTFVTIINLGDDISPCNVTVFHSSSMNDHNYRLIDRRTYLMLFNKINSLMLIVKT